MQFTEISMLIPVQNPENPEDFILKPQDIKMNLESISFIFKKPLEPQIQIVSSMPGPVITTTMPSEADLEAAGLVSIETMEGAIAWFNPKKVEFYFTPELGVYVLMFLGGARLGAKTTEEELLQKLGVSRGIIA